MSPGHDEGPGGDQGLSSSNVTAKQLAQCPTGDREKPLAVAAGRGPDPSQPTDLDHDDLAVPDLTADAARALTDRIKKTVAFCDGLIVEAFEGAAWRALDYGTWDQYCEVEFAEFRMFRLGAGQRREAVGNMRQAGMSTRAIASGIGVSQTTVARHLSTESNDSVEQLVHVVSLHETNDMRSHGEQPFTVKSLDGRVRPATQPHAPTPQRRRPLPDAFLTAIRDLTRSAQRLTKLTQDDRFPDHAERVALSHRGELVRIREALTGALAALPKSESPS